MNSKERINRNKPQIKIQTWKYQDWYKVYAETMCRKSFSSIIKNIFCSWTTSISKSQKKALILQNVASVDGKL